MIPRRLLLFLPAALVILVSGSAYAQTPPTLVEKRVKDLGTVPQATSLVTISPDGEHLAWVIQRDDGHHLVCDGKESSGYDGGVEIVGFSPDGTRLAYKAWRGSEFFMGFAGREGRPLAGFQLVFAPRGEGFAQVVRQHEQSWVIHNGEAGPHFTYVSKLVFSPDGTRLAYRVRDGNRCRVVLDGRKGPPYDRLGDLTFSPDAKRFAYVASVIGAQNRSFIVCDGQEGPNFSHVDKPVFSPDGKRLAYLARARYRGNLLVCDDKVVAEDIGLLHKLSFSPDGRRLAFAGGDLKEQSVTCDGKKHDGTYEAVSELVFSPDGNHLAYAAARGNKWKVICDARGSVKEYDTWTFKKWDSPPGWMQPVPEKPMFSADGKHLFFKVRRERKPQTADRPVTLRRSLVIVDGVEGPEHDDLWLPESFRCYPEKLRCVVADRREVSLVEVDWPADRTWQDAFKALKP